MNLENERIETVLITGANGLLGHKLVGLLVQRDQVKVVATGLGCSRLPDSYQGYYEWETMDITSEEEVFRVFELYKPTVVIHAAAITQADICEEQQDEAYAVNVQGTAYLINAAAQFQSYFIFLSTDFVFDGENGPYAEEDTPCPVNYYGETKLAAEQLLQNSQLNWAIARTVLVYGVAEGLSRSNIILWVRASLMAGKTIQVVTDQIRTPTLVEDLADACFLMMVHRSKGIFHVSGADVLTPFQMATLTADYFGLDKRLLIPVNSATFTQSAKRPLKTGFIIQKVQNELDFEPKSFTSGIGILAKQLKLADS
ncbi:SDR family oxidoreductase [Mongoliitalea daihaiensis]|uniref:SDR family oxidoreductase n=1 Tax=Mongoliitalea daihaiensis TaxID=2782006 RepID=UPI001F37A97A|nr:SDR family oxidoreductase [Mongoliitalea daihaiensis]UJP65251.1 SDR family oxidoreductase [Mongoliitalea daihaiensis]